jgi:competence protein ComEC
MRADIFYSAVVGFMIAVVARSYMRIDRASVLFILLLGIVFVALYFLRERKRLFLIGGILLVSAALGVGRFNMIDRGPATALSEAVGTRVSLSGQVSEEPDPRDDKMYLVVTLPEASKAAGSRIRVTAPLYPRYFYGDVLKVEGLLRKPEVIKSDDGRIFDYAAYLEKDAIYFTLDQVKIEKTGQTKSLKRGLFAVKDRFFIASDRTIPEPESSLLAGMLFGAKKRLGKDLEETFQRAGVIHMVVLSGYNITIVADSIMKVFSGLPKMAAASFGGIGILLFVLLSGGGASVTRAAVMAFLVLFAGVIGRKYSITRALAVVAFFMVLFNPKILVHDVSFQLSFLATIGLIYLSPLIEARVGFITKRFKIREFFVSTVSTQLLVLPLLLYRMGEVSLVSIPANMLILFCIPSAMFFGFIAISLFFIHPAVAFPFGAVASVILGYILFIVGMLSRLPFASINISVFPLWLTILSYIFYVLLFLRYLPLGKPTTITKKMVV